MIYHWLLTSTFYGNWLPGDPRGFVSRVLDRRPAEPIGVGRKEHDGFGTPYDQHIPGLRKASEVHMKSELVRLTTEQAIVLLAQFHITTKYRRWSLHAAAIMNNHVHLVVSAPTDVDSTKILGDYKAYGSRVLTERWGRPPSQTWWTYAGSKRKLENEGATQAAIRYVLNQAGKLAVYPDP